MYEGIVRILTTAAVCAATGFVIMRLIIAFRGEDEIEGEFELSGTLEELEGHPEGASSTVWQFETPGPVVTRNIEAA